MSQPRPHALLSARVRTDAHGRVDLRSLTLATLGAWLEQTLQAGSRARQVYQCVWQQGAETVLAFEGVAPGFKRRLAAHAFIGVIEPELALESVDGTVKVLWKLHDGHTIESVLIPDGDRLTLCVSTQVGCAMACSFCLTGDMGLKRHLDPGEIASQPLQLQRQLAERGRRITNIVFMGMGEPLHNFDALIESLDLMLQDVGLNFSHRRVTVSTVGLVPRMAELAAASPVNLAVSVNATTEEQRRRVMPITHKWSLADLMQAIRDFPLRHNKRVTIEYVMMAGFNDTVDDAIRLFEHLRGVPFKVNLIPYNENPDRDIKEPTAEAIDAFQGYFVQRGFHCSVRTTRGTDISAACGQLGKARQQAEGHGWLEGARRVAGLL